MGHLEIPKSWAHHSSLPGDFDGFSENQAYRKYVKQAFGLEKTSPRFNMDSFYQKVPEYWAHPSQMSSSYSPSTAPKNVKRLPVEEPSDSSPDSTIISVASSLPPSVDFDNHTLRAELIKRGFRPGPIQDSTRTLYLKKLHALRKNPIIASCQGKTYSIELEKSLRTDDWMNNLTPYIELENKARSEFATSNKKWREGNAKTSFTYLLLDPRLTANLPAKAANQSNHVNWVTFVNSIFYVGKGKRSRPYSHLYQALNLWKSNFTQSQDKKVQHILDIWSDKVGVVCLHIFQNVIPAEAYTYEASMIDVLGLQNLKNLKCGNYYGAVASWPHKDRRMLGQYLLYKAMNIFLSEGERQLRPEDI